MRAPHSQQRLARALDGPALALLCLLALVSGGKAWLADHPQYDSSAPLHLDDPDGWATSRKIAALRSDPGKCRAVLERSGVAFETLDPAGSGACRREDRVNLTSLPLVPAGAPSTCAVGAALHRWIERGVQPAARAAFSSPVERIEHYGAYSCRRLYGRETGRWSEHATGNAIDIAAFVLADGTRISVLRDWEGDEREAAFLRAVREEACAVFGTVLSPDYNAAHADHFHFDQAARGFGGVCR